MTEYEAVLAKEPNRYRSTLGAARAASAAGDQDRAKNFFKAVVELAKDADTAPDGLEEARLAISRG